MSRRSLAALTSLTLIGLLLASSYSITHAAKRTSTTSTTLTPTITLTVPSPASGTVTINATASVSGLKKIVISLDGTQIQSCTSSSCAASWITTQSTNGSHTVAAKALDRRNRVLASTSTTVQVDNDLTPPLVSLSAPSTATGSVTLSASASDAGGVASITIAVDGVALNAQGASVTFSPPAPSDASTSVTWDTSNASAGTHTVQAFATDVSGNVGSSPVASVVVSTGTTDPTPIPQLSQWESNMLSYGQTHCTSYDDPALTFDQKLAMTYYDAMRVFRQIANYTGDASWNTCVTKAATIYRDGYVTPNNGAVPGYWNFTTGLTMDALQTGSTASQQSEVLLSQNAAYAQDWVPLDWTQGAEKSREVAYAIMSYLNAEDLGQPRRSRLADMVNQALGHIDQWFISQTFREPISGDVPDAIGQYYIQPFMAGLTAQALILYYQHTGDTQVLPYVKMAMDWLWANAWVAADQAFWYDNWTPDPSQPFPAKSGAPDLNLLIAPAFAWLYQQTGDATYRDRGDQIFAGGVAGAWLDASKQFNQNYMWSFDYVQWRSGQ